MILLTILHSSGRRRQGTETPPMSNPLTHILYADLRQRGVTKERATLRAVLDVEQDPDSAALGDEGLRFRGVQERNLPN